MLHTLAKRKLTGRSPTNRPRLLAIALALFLTPVALVSAGPPLDVCLPLCSVPSTANGYATPATVVVSGSTLEWTSADGQYHTSTSADYALDARIFAEGEASGPGAARFEIRDGGLFIDDGDGLGLEPSTSAVDVGGGAFVLEYKCLFHGRFQKGAVVVVPSAT